MPVSNLAADFADSSSIFQTAPHSVYTRQRWDEEWVYQPHLFANNAVWALAPGTSTAELSWHYGRVKYFDEATWQQVIYDGGSRRYVKIVWQNPGWAFGDSEIINPTWYGIVNGTGTIMGGVRNSGDGPYETGHQSIQCVGLEKLLDETPICTSAWYSLEAAGRRFVDRGITFNEERADGTMGGNLANVARWVDGLPLFSGQPIDDDEFWTTPLILKYLLRYHRPMDAAQNPLPFALLDTVIDDTFRIENDRPQVESHGRTVRDILNQLIPYQRFVSWKIEVDEAFNAIFIVVVSLAGDDIFLPTGDIITANPRRWLLDIDRHRCEPVLTLSHAESVDRVRIQGARATATFTISSEDGTLVAGWTAAQETLYETGASGTANYAATTDKAVKNRLHAEVRARDKIRMVYSLFKVPDDWDFVAKNGVGGAGFTVYSFLDTETPGFLPCQRTLYLESHLAIRDGYNYATLDNGAGVKVDPVKIENGPFNFLPPIVLIRIPPSGTEASRLASNPRYVYIDRNALASEPETVVDDPLRQFSGHVSVPSQYRGFQVRVNGSHQYYIAGDDYTKKDEETLYVPWDWQTIIATFTAKMDWFCQGIWPPLADLPPLQDHIREAVLSAGDEYRWDWMVPGTVIGLDTEGSPERCALGGYIQDDRLKLTERARLAFEWYGITRRAISLPTPKINGSIQLGDFVVQVGNLVSHPVNTVITSVRIDCPPAGIGGQPNTPMMTLTTDYVADMDLYLSPNLQAARSPSAAAAGKALLPGPTSADYMGDAYVKGGMSTREVANWRSNNPSGT